MNQELLREFCEVCPVEFSARLEPRQHDVLGVSFWAECGRGSKQICLWPDASDTENAQAIIALSEYIRDKTGEYRQSSFNRDGNLRAIVGWVGPTGGAESVGANTLTETVISAFIAVRRSEIEAGK